jgi:hypothetical protein
VTSWPGLEADRTVTPLSCRFSACACPCDPKPMMPTRRARMSVEVGELS